MTTVDMAKAKDRSKEELDKAASSTWLERMARWGLLTRGALYLVVAVLTFQVARGHRVQRVDRNGALFAVFHQPLGRVLLVVLAGGFAGYALWRFVEAAAGTGDDEGAADLAKRGLRLVRGLLYATLFLSTVRLIVWSSSSSGSDTAQADWTARVLHWPGGRALVMIVGLGFVIGGACLGWQGLSRGFRNRLETAEMSRPERRLILGLGATGLVARSAVAAVIGIFFMAAATHRDPNEAVGIDGALKRLADRPWGPAVLVLMAVGLAAYGLYSIAEARYRRVGCS